MHDFVAIGDTVTDAFIKLHEARVNCDIDRDNCAIAAVVASRLGLMPALVSDLGDDQNGKECLESLEKNKVDKIFIKIHPGKETNYHYVLWYEDDRTILVKHHEYE